MARRKKKPDVTDIGDDPDVLPAVVLEGATPEEKDASMLLLAWESLNALADGLPRPDEIRNGTEVDPAYLEAHLPYAVRHIQKVIQRARARKAACEVAREAAQKDGEQAAGKPATKPKSPKGNGGTKVHEPSSK